MQQKEQDVPLRVDEDPARRLADTRLFCLDMDGTVYLENIWIEGAREFLQAIRRAGKRYCFLTNNSSRGSLAYVEKMAGMGLAVEPRVDLITSGQVTIDYLQSNYAGKSVYLFGNPSLRTEFAKAGIRLEEEHPDVVVTAFHTGFSYEDLLRLCRLVREGLPYLATHPDNTCPTAEGPVPDIGALSVYVEAATGRLPDAVMGKPSSHMVDYILKQTGAPREETCIVGDRLSTDIRTGLTNGLLSVLVLTGETTLPMAQASPWRPDLTFSSVKEMIPFLEEGTTTASPRRER